MNTAEPKLKQTQTHRIRSAMRWLDERPVRLCFFWALFLNLVVECLAQRAILAPLVHAVTQPYLFALNALLIFFTLSLCLMIPKRYFALCFVSLVWLGLAVANFVLLGYRVTPLSAIDFALLGSVFSIIGIYLNLYQIVAVVLAFVAALALLWWIAVHTPKRAVSWWRSLRATAVSMLLTAGLIALGFYSDTLPTTMANLGDAYREYGFVYCFSCSVVDRGIDRPEDYEEDIHDLAVQYESKPIRPLIQPLQVPEDLTPETTPESSRPVTEESAQTVEPNVIFLQLESFVDPEEIVKYDYSEDPTPTFRRLKALYPSGYLTVPSIGAGTANTEFEVITGMALQFFGVGEYPYRTVLRDNTCETVAFNLKERGYTATAIHNNKATFYDRHEVFSKLGFDRFVALEYMNGVRYNAQGWACDDVLADTILDTLTTTEERDLIYTISVQGHGRYPDEAPEEGHGAIAVTGEEDPVLTSRMEYYVNQLLEMDAFLYDLIAALREFDEPTVLVLYGDHLPAMGLTEEDLLSEDLFKTEYVIWNNFDRKTEDKDLNAYQLTAHVMEFLGYDNGILTRYHREYADAADYLQQLEMLEYDMLYGEQVVYDGENPYTATDITLGLHEISVRTIGMMGKTMYVFGENFTPYSVVCINGKQQETVFMSPYSLCVKNVDFTTARVVSVQQVSEEQEVLSETGRYIIE